jgi:hypothetical protein
MSAQEPKPSCSGFLWRVAARLALLVLASTTAKTKADLLKHNFVAEHEIARCNQVDPGKLPSPKSESIVTNPCSTWGPTCG